MNPHNKDTQNPFLHRDKAEEKNALINDMGRRNEDSLDFILKTQTHQNRKLKNRPFIQKITQENQLSSPRVLREQRNHCFDNSELTVNKLSVNHQNEACVPAPSVEEVIREQKEYDNSFISYEERLKNIRHQKKAIMSAKEKGQPRDPAAYLALSKKEREIEIKNLDLKTEKKDQMSTSAKALHRNKNLDEVNKPFDIVHMTPIPKEAQERLKKLQDELDAIRADLQMNRGEQFKKIKKLEAMQDEIFNTINSGKEESRDKEDMNNNRHRLPNNIPASNSISTQSKRVKKPFLRGFSLAERKREKLVNRALEIQKIDKKLPQIKNKKSLLPEKQADESTSRQSRKVYEDTVNGYIPTFTIRYNRKKN